MNLSDWINIPLLSEPLNWFIVWLVLASFTLFIAIAFNGHLPSL
jgi:hypothetical protein